MYVSTFCYNYNINPFEETNDWLINLLFLFLNRKIKLINKIFKKNNKSR